MLLDLGCGHLNRTVVGNSRGHNDGVGIPSGPSDGVVQLHGSTDRHDLHLARQSRKNRENIVSHIGRHKSHSRTALYGGARRSDPLASRRAVAHIPHRIDRLTGATGRNDHMPARQRSAPGRPRPARPSISEHGQRLGDNALRIGQPTLPRVGTRQASGIRVDDAQATALQRGHVLPGRRIGPHLSMHGGGKDHGGRRRQNRGSQQIVGTTGRDPCQQVGRGRGHHNKVRPLSHRDMFDGSRVVENTAAHRPPCDRCQSRRADEAQRGIRCDHANLVPRLSQTTDHERGLVGGDGTGHPDDNTPRTGWDVRRHDHD